ncbi:YbaB/EbfC family nucleoid-associated protein [Thermomicrobiaceae bacterium CFH 74404]|uniref:Nucleoid-associated protein NET02_07655 n=2 Tax=Thermomicrobia TaxID=189775 RepID=A0AA41WA90_9BACT|nr:YbaB/EbfC family nucleoid-associated protein [Thermalbibacter longus]MCM8749014.1 YbaB/EbfC family nucleoid-associated protein [Thermalbibacter longus]
MQPNLKMIQQMQARLAQLQEELAATVVEGTAGGGAVRVEVNGLRAVQRVKIDPSVLDPDDVELLEDMIVAAINEAMKRAEEQASQKLGAITGGLGLKLPGLM